MTGYLQHKTWYAPQIRKPPSLNLGLALVIPARCEAYLLLLLMQLDKCLLPLCDVEVIVVVNDALSDPQEVKISNRYIIEQAEAWISRQPPGKRIRYHLVYIDDFDSYYPAVHLARKIGMDEAAWRMEKAHIPHGIIACLDADSKVDNHFLVQIVNWFQQHPKCNAAYAEGQYCTSGPDYEPKVYQSAALYEIELRYLQIVNPEGGITASALCGAWAMRNRSYQANGGIHLNAGALGFTLCEPKGKWARLPETTVLLSPRMSGKRPMGSAEHIRKIFRSKQSLLLPVPPAASAAGHADVSTAQPIHWRSAVLTLLENYGKISTTGEQQELLDLLREIAF